MAGKVLDPHLWNLENLFKSIYDVPVYQRPYSWDKEQVDVLLDDIIETYKSAISLKEHRTNKFKWKSLKEEFKKQPQAKK